MRARTVILTLLLSLGIASLLRAQPLTISTLAGNAGRGNADGTGPAARFLNPGGIAADTSGNLYVADTDNHTIRKITSSGTVTTLAGSTGVSGTNDGTGLAAKFNQPQGVVVDSLGNVYVADTGNHTIRKITAGGVVTTLAGSAGNPGSVNATGNSASFYQPEGIAVNASGTLIFVADTWNHLIRQVTSGGVVTTLAGSAGNPGSGNGTGAGASFYQPQGIAVDGAGIVYVGDTGNATIRMIEPSGLVTTLAGSPGVYGSANGTGAAAQFYQPMGVAVDGSGNVYVADSFNNTIRKVASGGVVTTLAGASGVYGSADGTGTSARFYAPQAVARIGTTIYVADTGNGTIRQVSASGTTTTVAGFASNGSADGPGGDAQFYWPQGAAVDASGNTYVGDTFNHTIRKITSAGTVTTLAGLAGNAGSSDGSGGSALFNGPEGLAVDSGANIYVADTGNSTVRKVTPGGAVTTLAGTAGVAGAADGNGTSAKFSGPQAVAVGSSGLVYVADTQNHTIRQITTGGTVTTLAGVAGYPGNLDSAGVNNGTNAARFSSPSGIAVDPAGNVFVADTANHTIRKVTAGGVVTTLAGSPGVWGYADGTNRNALFFLPRGLTIDSVGNLFVVDSGNHLIRMLVPAGTNWVVSTVAGQPDVDGSADGTGSGAQFYYPGGIGLNNGVFGVADSGNSTIRSAVSSVNSSPVVITQPQNQTTNQGQSAVFSVTATGSGPLYYQWNFNSSPLSGATASAYTVTNAQPSNAGPYFVIVSNSLGTMPSSNAVLTVIVPPTITNQPQSQTITQGFNATFTVGATANATLAYQWVFGNANISGATASSYTRTNVQPSDGGNYLVIVSDSAGAVTSAPPAVLTVIAVPTAPTISAQPTSRSVAQGSNATFSVTATGTTPLYYQWLFNGGPIAGATDSSYTRVAAQPADSGPYSVVVSNSVSTTLSSNAQLSVIVPPIINAPPVSHLVAVSNSVSFSVGLSQGTSPAYQWSQNGTPLSGATQSSFSISSVTWTNAGTYSVTVSNLTGQASASAVLTVEQAAFSFLEGFESYNTGGLDKNQTSGPNVSAANPWWALNTSANGWVTNAGSGVTPRGGAQLLWTTNSGRQDYLNLLYRMNAGQPYYGNFLCEWWFYDPYGTNASGATNSQDYLALCSDVPVSTTSDASASFTSVNQRMSLGAYNGNVGYNYSNYQARIIGGSGGTFGSGNSWRNTSTIRSVGWHHARVIVGIPDATNAAAISMYIDNMTNATAVSPTAGTNGFNLIELNHSMSKVGYGYFYDDLTFRADNDPWIIEQPVSQTVNPGQAVLFNTVAVGTAYQWQFNGTNIGGATSSSYALASAAATNGGAYACIISGANGALATSNAVLTVISPSLPGHFDQIYLLGNGAVQLNMSGSPNTNYTLLNTTDWLIWNTNAVLPSAGGLFQFTDSPATDSQRFYRLRLGP
jgi:sugar lactone lactonase YvrE